MFFVVFLNSLPYICSGKPEISIIIINKIIKVMNKTELIEKIAAGSGLTKAQSKAALDETVKASKEALVAGDKIALVGFGTFSVGERPAREGINPLT